MAAGTEARGRKNQVRSGKDPLTFYPGWCKKCGLCVAFCPKEVLAAGPGGQPFAAQPEACVRCHLCALRCPDFAVSVADAAREAAA